MVDKQSLVSIIVPVRDGELFVDATLGSAAGQSYRNIEIIVVDDGSLDGTGAIVDAWIKRDSRIRVVNQTNQGVAAARNRGIAEARGEFIAPLDADDLWDPTKIERQVGRMMEAGPDTGLVYCWWITVDGKGAVLDSSPQWRVEGRAFDPLVQVNYTGNSSVPLFRRCFLERIGGYDVTLRERNAEGCEDFDVALKIAELSRVSVVPSYLVAYRKHRDTLSTETRRMWRSYELVLSAAGARHPDLSRTSIRTSRDQLALYLAGVSWWAGSHTQALAWGLRALRSTVTLAALPYIARVVSMSVSPASRPTRSVINSGDHFSEWKLPQPLIPYDRLYRRRFQQLRNR